MLYWLAVWRSRDLDLDSSRIQLGAFLSRISHCTNECRRREDRGAEGAEGRVGSGEGVSCPPGSGAEPWPETNLLDFIGPQVASD